jgi:hypothetical protein
MKPALHRVVLACALCAGTALGGERIEPTFGFDDMRVVVKYVSTGELVKLQRDYGARVNLRDVRQSFRHGFSLLRRSRETGILTCEIYLPNEMRPLEVDDEATLSLGHELLHCMLGDYHK